MFKLGRDFRGVSCGKLFVRCLFVFLFIVLFVIVVGFFVVILIVAASLGLLLLCSLSSCTFLRSRGIIVLLIVVVVLLLCITLLLLFLFFLLFFLVLFALLLFLFVLLLLRVLRILTVGSELGLIEVLAFSSTLNVFLELLLDFVVRLSISLVHLLFCRVCDLIDGVFELEEHLEDAVGQLVALVLEEGWAILLDLAG